MKDEREVFGHVPSISTVTASISNAADAVSNTAASLTKPLAGAASSIAGLGASMSDFVDKIKVCLILLIGLLVVMGVVKIIRFVTR